MALRNMTTRMLVLVGVVSLSVHAEAIAQGSRLNFRGSPSRLNQRGPVPKVANPAAPKKMPSNRPPTPKPPNPPGHGGGHDGHHHYYYPYYWYYGGYYDYWWNRRKTYDGPLLVEQVRKYDPEVISESPAPPREVDEGLEALRRQDYRLAADILSRRLAEQEREEAKDPPGAGLSDREDQRLLAIALIGEKRMDDALRHALEAYRKDGSLRERPILGSSVIPSSAERTELVRTAVNYAQRRDAPESAWLLAAMLMEADDRPDDARRVLARAEIDLGEIVPARPATTPEPAGSAEPPERGGEPSPEPIRVETPDS